MKANVYDFIEQCCANLFVSPQTVIDDLLSFEDEQDIANGDVSMGEVTWIIALWAKDGCVRKSDKPLLSDRRQSLSMISELLNGK